MRTEMLITCRKLGLEIYDSLYVTLTRFHFLTHLTLPVFILSSKFEHTATNFLLTSLNTTT